MALEQIHLRKLLKIMFSEPNRVQSALRTDIREDIARETTGSLSGGDFYAPFWADAQEHVFGRGDLHMMVDDRIAANYRRTNLYPSLRDGFLAWWNGRRRWTNAPFKPGQRLYAQFEFPGVDAVVKVQSILSVTDSLGVERAVYPYFAPDPVLSEPASRFGLWLLINAFPTVPSDEFRILDVIRGRTFSLDRTPLVGSEEEQFRARFAELMRQRDALREEYE